MDDFSYPFIFVNISESALLGATTIVPGIAGRRLRVIGYHFTSTVAANVVFKSNNGGTHGSADLGINGEASFAGNIFGPAFDTDVGKGVDMSASVTTGVHGHLTYMVL